MKTEQLPDSRRGRTFRKLLGVLYVGSIVGITLTLRELVARLLDAGIDHGRLQVSFLALQAVLLAGWGLICWTAYRGSRHRLAPPAWAYVAVVALSWAAILLNRLG